MTCCILYTLLHDKETVYDDDPILRLETELELQLELQLQLLVGTAQQLVIVNNLFLTIKPFRGNLFVDNLFNNCHT